MSRNKEMGKQSKRKYYSSLIAAVFPVQQTVDQHKE